MNDDSSQSAKVTGQNSGDQVQQGTVQQDQNNSGGLDSGQDLRQTQDVARMTVQSSLPGKENAPRPLTAEQSDGEQAIAIPKPPEHLIEETAPEVKVAPEVAEAGVEPVKTEVMEVSPELKQQGVQPTGAAVPIKEEPTLNLPMTEEEAEKIVKSKKSWKESVVWMATMIIKQIKQFKFNQEKTHPSHDASDGERGHHE